MAAIEVTRIKYGWQVIIGDLTLEAESPHFDRGAIRATLTVRNHTAIFYRDTTNLTSAKTHERILKQLQEKQLPIEDRVLIALDEACCTSRPGRVPEPCG